MQENLRKKRIGVLLVNLGTPAGTDFRSMRRYLAEFLSDRRVIEWSRLVWYPVLHGIVLNTRPKKSGAAYQRIWNTALDESPLRTYTRQQAELLQAAFAADTADTVDIDVEWAMRYGAPSIDKVTRAMAGRGCERIVMFPLYPQYSATTTATVCDAFFDSLKTMRFVPAVRTVPAYPEDPVYIEALAASIQHHLATLDFTPEVVLASYHGIPQSYAKRGDPYPDECLRTTNALRQKLGWSGDRLRMTFQSRFGPEEWLQPYTDKTVEQLAREGMKSVAVLNPGFVSDCLETVDEIGNEVAHIFRAHGGENFTHIPCLNADAEGMKVIEHLVRRELAGWL
ncbi:MAG: Ferrochelatase [Candidatus Tokpelaia hoelldobleri]|uniref:Ferrochelatase n=1 Tax=Candidatus Tokpelaia hoelldobleri TaxID=1902579 RepID=A0A1U9JTC5_9HYPH|nr:MAG: Ferrochelatase [Candidatus Tokpelaia hoelldoblerii]